MEILFCQLSFYALESHMSCLSSMLLFFETTRWGSFRTLLLMSCDLCFGDALILIVHKKVMRTEATKLGSMTAATCLRK